MMGEVRDAATDKTIDYRKYLDPKVLAKIGPLELRARLMVEGYVSGMHSSPYQGVSIEFAGHREYAQGDDIRHVDWKVFARTDKYYVKEYEEETNLTCQLVVDCSESMAYRGDAAGMSKHEYATCLAASIAYLTLAQQDSVGCTLFDNKITRMIRPSNNPSQWKVLVHELEGATGPSKTSLRKVLDELAESGRGRMLVILISDLFDDPDEALKGLKHLRYRKNDVIVWQVMDRAELEFPFRGPTLFQGLEGTGRLLVEPRSLRARYLEEVGRFLETWRRHCRSLGIDYQRFETDTPLDLGLGAYLATRSVSLRRVTK